MKLKESIVLKFDEFNSLNESEQEEIKSRVQKEYNDLIHEFGEETVKLTFPSGFEGYYYSRTKGNYSVDSIKHTLGAGLNIEHYKNLLTGKIKAESIDSTFTDINPSDDHTKEDTITLNYITDTMKNNTSSMTIEYKWSWKLHKGKEGDGKIQPNDPDEFELTGLDVISISVCDDDDNCVEVSTPILKKLAETLAKDYIKTDY